VTRYRGGASNKHQTRVMAAGDSVGMAATGDNVAMARVMSKHKQA